MQTRYVAYARVSTSEQAERGKSIEDQLAKLAHEAQQRGGTLLRAFADPGFSGSNLNRPELAALLAFCGEQDVDAVLVVDTDRLARKTEHHFVIKTQLRKLGVRVESLNQPMIDDTPEGVFLDTILAATNALYPQITGRNTSPASPHKAPAGGAPGPARRGNRNADNPSPVSANDRRIIVSHETNGPLVSRAFSLYAAGGHTLKSLCAEMEALGLRSTWGGPVTKTSMRKMLTDPFYVGRAEYKGEERRWNHPPLTDEETFQRCRLVLGAHNRYADRMRKHTFLLSGLLRCGLCGASLTASVNGKKGRSYYHCPVNRQHHSNAGQNVPVEELDAQVGSLLRSVSLTPETADKVIRRAREIVAETHGEVNTRRRELLAQRGVLENRRERLETMYLDGAATEDTYRRQSGQLSESLDKIGLEIARLELGRDGNVKVFEQMMRLAVNAEAAFEAAPMPLKRTYLKLFFEEIVVRDRKIVSARLTLAFESLLNNHPIYSEGVPAGNPGEVEMEQKETPDLIGSGASLESVINSEGWLPGPSEFITFLGDPAYWSRVRQLLPAYPQANQDVSCVATGKKRR